MKIGFIGAGRVGFTLGKYFTERNMYVSGYYSRNPQSAKEAAAFTGSDYYKSVSELAERSNVIFITTPDDEIEGIWERLKILAIKDKIICHCSGALSSAVFSEIDQMGAFGYSIHPLYAVSNKLTSYRDISQAFFTIEGHDAYLSYWKNLFESWGHNVQVISADHKIKYHSAAVFASNYVVALMNIATNLLMECGFDRDAAAKALIPIAGNNMNNIADHGIFDALTGPVERGDISTLKKHLEVLDGSVRALYVALAGQLLEVAKVKNKSRDYSAVEMLLKN